MGAWGFLFFGEKDEILCEEIAKLHRLNKEDVEKHYRKMLDEIKNTNNKKESE